MLESTRSQLIKDICRRFAAVSGAMSEAWLRLPVKSPVLGVRSGNTGAAAPQISQNLSVGEISVPHSGQFNPSSAPQPPQNFARFRFSYPHWEHRMLHPLRGKALLLSPPF